jgi:hypothetical protein
MDEANDTQTTEDPARCAEPAGSPPTYEIATVADFLTVPEDRWDACLKDFREFLGLASALKETADVMADLLGADKDKNKVESFTWIDDGKEERTVTIRCEENVELRHGGSAPLPPVSGSQDLIK